MSAADLFSWVEYSKKSMFRISVLMPLHKARLIEFDSEKGLARISPLGSKMVEESLLKTMSQ